MKKIISIILAICMIAILAAACAGDPPQVADTTPAVADPTPTPPADQPGDAPTPTPEAPTAVPEPVAPEIQVLDRNRDMSFPGIIAIVTNTVDQNEEEFRSAEMLIERFGAENVIHMTWPVYFATEPEMMISVMNELASNPDVGAIIINQAVVNTNAAIDAARATRASLIGHDNLFIVSCSFAEDPRDVYARVDLSLDINNPGVPEFFVAQAVAMGADAIIHYSFPRHLAVPMLSARRDGIQRYAEAAGLRFECLPTPDPMEEGGMAASQLFVSQDVGRQVERLRALGYENIVFFTTNCGQQIPLLNQVLAYGMMYVQPCCPSPFHAFPAALGLAETQAEAFGRFSTAEILAETSRVIAERGMTGRLSNWALPGSVAYTTVGFLYAVEWLNDRVSQEIGVVDKDVLLALFGEFAEDVLGVRDYPVLTNLSVGGDTFSTLFVIIMPYFLY